VQLKSEYLVELSSNIPFLEIPKKKSENQFVLNLRFIKTILRRSILTKQFYSWPGLLEYSNEEKRTLVARCFSSVG
jgi:hypothetical protein